MAGYALKQDAISSMLRLQRIYQRQLEGKPACDPARQLAMEQDSRRLKTSITQACQQADLLTKQLDKLLDRLPDQQEAESLRLCYLKGLRTVDAAEVMGYSLRQFQRIKRRALNHLEGLLP